MLGIPLEQHGLRMPGIPINRAAELLRDNKSVVLNKTFSSSQLMKKHNVVNYRRVREDCTANIISFSHIDSEYDLADLTTKSLGKTTFYKSAKQVLFRVPKVSKADIDEDDMPDDGILNNKQN